ncbi:MAG: cation:proton antiporter [Leptolyngbyaceae bacterium]|nr:cation:proton antiporter [Leptolyngbyaceae bacterium]
MIGYLDLLLRLVIWFLLTADGSLANIVIGIIVVILLPRNIIHPSAISEWVRVLWEIIVAIPQAYIEAIEMILFPHEKEDITLEQVKPNRTPGLIFLDIFLITFTPKTIVLNYQEDGWYEVHRVCRRKKD